jgi:hypothetical protein
MKETIKAEPKEERINGIDKWKVENDLDTCMRYHEVMSDPRRKKAVGMLAKQRAQKLQKLASK